MSLLKSEQGYGQLVSTAVLIVSKYLGIEPLPSDVLKMWVLATTQKYYYFKLHEVLYVLRKGMSGEYGLMFEMGHQPKKMSTEILNRWLEKYDTEERADIPDYARTVQAEQLLLGDGDGDRKLSKNEVHDILEDLVESKHIQTVKSKKTRVIKLLSQKVNNYVTVELSPEDYEKVVRQVADELIENYKNQKP